MLPRRARALALFLLPATLPAQIEVLDAPRRLADVPTIRSVLGHEVGARIVSPEESTFYLRALAAASDRATLFRYGQSHEGRPLQYLVVGTPEHLADLEAIRAGMAKLADPRGADDAELARLCAELPATTWLANSVHGNEISCTDAALLLAWHLCSADGDELVDKILAETLVVIDPLQNPDGRARFVHHARSTRGRFTDGSPAAAERDEPWPGGRTNHALFDLNRDWFACTQPETLGRIKNFRTWWPVSFVDLHEMGSNSSYYFPPPAKPWNPALPAEWHAWQEQYGRNNAAWFDRHGFDYFTRESFDAFYPGYGDTWPGLHGAISATYEEASIRGLVVEREDDTVRTFPESVLRHFVASLATCETTAWNREAALQRFLGHRRGAIQRGLDGPTREFVLLPSPDRWRTDRLARRLAFQGLEVDRLDAAVTRAGVRDHGEDPASAAERTLPAGAYVVRTDQPAGLLATALLSRHQDMDPEFVAEQLRRHARRESPEIYDVTAWSLPLLQGVAAWETASPTDGALTRLVVDDLAPLAIDPGQHAEGPTPTVAWVVPAGSNGTAILLATLLRTKARVHCAGKAFRIGDRKFAPGSLLVKTADNGPEVHALVRALDAALGLDCLPVDSSWVDEGVHFGSNEVHYVKPPKVALAWNEPTSSYGAGAVRHVLEERFGVPVVEVRAGRLARADLTDFDVIVLPDGGDYGDEFGGRGAEALKAWIRAGGTLVTLGGGATSWLTGDGVGLLATRGEDRERAEKDKDEDKEKDKPEQKSEGDDAAETAEEPAKPAFDYDQAILPDEESPARTPGAILRVDLDPEHWLAFGLGTAIDVIGRDRAIYTPVKLDAGRNVGIYAARDALLRAGFAWEDKLDQLAKKAFLVHQPHGDGHVVAFAEDPTTRGMVEGTDLLLLNAVLLGAAF